MKMDAQPRNDALILCVEDEESLRRDIAEELTEVGYRVVEAASYEEARSQLAVVRPDLILCDICLPGMDGYDLLRSLQANPDDYADIPFIFLSALADRREVVEGKQLGADDYLTKPVDFDLMLATVQARLRQITRIRAQASRSGQKIEAQFATLSGDDNLTSDAGFGAVLDLISTAIVLVGPERDVRFVNRSARELAQTGADLTACLTHWAGSPHSKADLAAWLDTMFGSVEDTSVSSFNLPCGDGVRSLQMVGCRLESDGTASPRLALFIAKSERTACLSPDTLTAMFGFTPSESLIAVALVKGQNPAEIATSLSIAQTTVAFHMRNIFQKTGVSRQASLVALLLTSPASIL